MHDQDLRGRKRHSRKPRTTDSRHKRPVAENRLAKCSAPTKANQIRITDITYLQTSEGWLFLAAIRNAWSCRVVGWACAPTLHRAIRNASGQVPFFALTRTQLDQQGLQLIPFCHRQRAYNNSI